MKDVYRGIYRELKFYPILQYFIHSFSIWLVYADNEFVHKNSDAPRIPKSI